MQTLNLSSSVKREVIDLTDKVNAIVGKSGVRNGVCHLAALHTTVALSIADLDPGTDLDLLDAFEAMVPKLHYRHPHDPSHVGDHIFSCLIGPTVCVPVKDGGLLLGQWQRLILLEFAGPRERTVALTITPDT